MAEQPQKHVDIAPDPDEDDLDDLDDVLDEFQATTITPSQPQPTSTKPAPDSTTTQNAPSNSGPGRPTDVEAAQSLFDVGEDGLPSDQDFAKQLQAGMANLISELDANPEVQVEFEKMMQELIAAGAAPSDGEAAEHLSKATSASQQAAAAGNAASPSASNEGVEASSKSKKPSSAAGPGSGGLADDKFQDTIRRTMERMQASGDAATAATSTPDAGGSEDDLLAQMMRELSEGGGLGAALGGAGGSDGGLNSMLLSMMAQLTHKDILYEPMKELHDKFPAWLAANRGTQPKEDLERYDEQHRLVNEIVQRFERKGYSDESTEDREYIVERMQKMQSAGSPPADLVGDMNSAQEAIGELDAGCPTQ